MVAITWELSLLQLFSHFQWLFRTAQLTPGRTQNCIERPNLIHVLNEISQFYSQNCIERPNLIHVLNEISQF